jgi:ABC-type multidrug transport system permease subunit
MSSITVFPPERAVFLQEQTNGMYNAYLYYLSKVISEIPLNIVIPAVYTIVTYWSWGLVNTAVAFFNHLVTVLVLSYTANAFGLFMAALFANPQIAFTIAPLMLMPQMIGMGLFANTERLEPYWVWLNYIAFPRYAYKSLMLAEFNNIGTLCNGVVPSANVTSTCRYNNGQEVLTYYGFTKTTDTVWFSIVIMLIIMLFFRFIGATALYVQGRQARAELAFESNYRKSAAYGPDSIEMRRQ